MSNLPICYRSRHSRSTIMLPNELLDALPARESDDESAEESSNFTPDRAVLIKQCKRLLRFVCTKSELKVLDAYVAGKDLNTLAAQFSSDSESIARLIANAALLARSIKSYSLQNRAKTCARTMKKAAACIVSENKQCCRRCMLLCDDAISELLKFAATRFVVPPRDAGIVMILMTEVLKRGCSSLTQNERVRIANALLRTANAVESAGFRDAFLSNPMRARRLITVEKKDMESLAQSLKDAEAGY